MTCFNKILIIIQRIGFLFIGKDLSKQLDIRTEIDNINNIDDVYDGFDRSKKKQIKKGLKEVEIRYDLSAREFYESHVQTLAQNGKKISYSYDVFNRIYENAKQRDSGKIIAAFDQDKNFARGLFLLFGIENVPTT